jgi:hypothetical protein
MTPEEIQKFNELLFQEHERERQRQLDEISRLEREAEEQLSGQNVVADVATSSALDGIKGAANSVFGSVPSNEGNSLSNYDLGRYANDQPIDMTDVPVASSDEDASLAQTAALEPAPSDETSDWPATVAGTPIDANPRAPATNSDPLSVANEPPSQTSLGDGDLDQATNNADATALAVGLQAAVDRTLNVAVGSDVRDAKQLVEDVEHVAKLDAEAIAAQHRLAIRATNDPDQKRNIENAGRINPGAKDRIERLLGDDNQEPTEHERELERVENNPTEFARLTTGPVGKLADKLDDMRIQLKNWEDTYSSFNASINKYLGPGFDNIRRAFGLANARKPDFEGP